MNATTFPSLDICYAGIETQLDRQATDAKIEAGLSNAMDAFSIQPIIHLLVYQDLHNHILLLLKIYQPKH